MDVDPNRCMPRPERRKNNLNSDDLQQARRPLDPGTTEQDFKESSCPADSFYQEVDLLW